MPSEEYKAAKRHQDRLTYTPGMIFSAAIVLIAVFGEHVGETAAVMYAIPLFAALMFWWVQLARASVRTFRILKRDQQEWRAHRRVDHPHDDA